MKDRPPRLRTILVIALAMLSGHADEASGARPETPAASEVAKWPRLSEKIDQLYAQVDRSHTPGGVAAVIYRGELIHLKGYGAANRELDVPWTSDTRYRIASVTKSFVAHAVLLLENRGRLRLEDPLHRHLPDFPVFDTPVRLRHLLSMTSGLWQDESLLAQVSAGGPATLDEMYSMSKLQRRLNYAPGSAASYVDTNFRLLARVIAAVTGQPFARAMHELIFEPLGMTSTAFEVSDDMAPRLASVYARGPDGAFGPFDLAPPHEQTGKSAGPQQIVIGSSNAHTFRRDDCVIG